MKVLFATLKYDYGRPNNGLSVEYTNFFDALNNMKGIDAEFFAIDEYTAKVGKKAANELLIQKVKQDNPDLLFCYLLNEELEKETISFITNKTQTKTFNWFADDHWRVPVYSRYWAPLFTLVSTTDSKALEIYKSYGINNVIKTQWAANTRLYKPVSQNILSQYNITFVGKNFGKREKYIKFLSHHGLAVKAFGSGWEAGRLGQEKMIECFSNSKINLNFSETYNNRLKSLVKLFLEKTENGYRFTGHNFYDNLLSYRGRKINPIKGRVFEVPACGGFLLTGKSDDNISNYYIPNKEIVLFENKEDLVDKCRYYLSHESERVKIAQAGYERTIKDHTYQKRFSEIFNSLNL
jgi:spore maturation protein CgeB